jgi:hypothetical protein
MVLKETRAVTKVAPTLVFVPSAVWRTKDEQLRHGENEVLFDLR